MALLLNLGELGEFGLIERLTELIAARKLPTSSKEVPAFPLLLGIGDDTAAWTAGTVTELLTTDTLVQDVHFTLETASWRDLGWKTLAVNLSDIAAMGGLPLYCVVTLGLPGATAVSDIDELYGGLLDACEAYSVVLVGGDVVRSEAVFITVALTGATVQQSLLRSAAEPGDQVAVTGTVGGSAGGLRMLKRGLAPDGSTAQVLREAHFRPKPRLAEGQALTKAGVRCAMDISDGLVDDLTKLCQASKLSARLFAERVPIDPALRQAFPKEYLSLALGGGEDYELLFTAQPSLMTKVLPALPAGGTVVGEVVPGPSATVSVLDNAGQVIPVSRSGWDHFRS